MSAFRLRLEQALERGKVRAIDVALADWCLRHGADPLVALGMLLARRALGEGHACLTLGVEEPGIPGEAAYCSTAALRAALEASVLVGGPGARCPLILEGDRLYLHRYWQYEERLAQRLRALMARQPEAVDLAPLRSGGGLFEYGWIAPGETNWQAVAAATALRHRLTVISGGPGTGKTYTVLRLIRLLIDAAEAAGQPFPEIRLAAPTGKAAARMMESIHRGLDDWPDGARIAERLPDQASTLHRLLGLRQGSTRPFHDRDNPLNADAVVVDEASMVDLPMMAKLVDALPEKARLILLGDRYQLASVESGSVLAELCDGAGTNAFSRAQREAFGGLLAPDAMTAPGPVSPLSDHVVTLRTSHRFHPQSPIGRFAAAVNEGHAQAALDAAGEGATEIFLELAEPTDLASLAEVLARAYGPLIETDDPMHALTMLDRVRLLTATRVGPAGVYAMNRRIGSLLAEAYGFDPDRPWFHGRPVIVLHNDYRAGLFNGDTGVCLRGTEGGLRVWFRTEEGVRSLLPTSMPDHETAFAMTVHKSQGSEFREVHLLLPSEDSPVLSRELVYTGVTRARERLNVHAPRDVLEAAINRRVMRRSGLAERLGR